MTQRCRWDEALFECIGAAGLDYKGNTEGLNDHALLSHSPQHHVSVCDGKRVVSSSSSRAGSGSSAASRKPPYKGPFKPRMSTLPVEPPAPAPCKPPTDSGAESGWARAQRYRGKLGRNGGKLGEGIQSSSLRSPPRGPATAQVNPSPLGTSPPNTA